AYRDSTYLEIRFSVDSRTPVAIETAASDYGPYDSGNYEHTTIWDTATGELTFTDYGYWSTPRYSPNAEWVAYITGNTSAPAELVIWNGVELLHTGVEYPSNIRFDAKGDTLYAAV